MKLKDVKSCRTFVRKLTNVELKSKMRFFGAFIRYARLSIIEGFIKKRKMTFILHSESYDGIDYVSLTVGISFSMNHATLKEMTEKERMRLMRDYLISNVVLLPS